LFSLITFKALNSLLCADVPLRNYSLTHSLGSMQHLSYMLVYFLTPVVDRADIITYRHIINLAVLWPAAVCQCYQMFKISGTEAVQKGTEVDLVVVPKVTSGSLLPKCICTEMDYPVVLNVTGTERDPARDHGVVHFGRYPFRYKGDPYVTFGTITRSTLVAFLDHFRPPSWSRRSRMRITISKVTVVVTVPSIATAGVGRGRCERI